MNIDILTKLSICIIIFHRWNNQTIKKSDNRRKTLDWIYFALFCQHETRNNSTFSTAADVPQYLILETRLNIYRIVRSGTSERSNSRYLSSSQIYFRRRMFNRKCILEWVLLIILFLCCFPYCEGDIISMRLEWLNVLCTLYFIVSIYRCV